MLKVPVTRLESLWCHFRFHVFNTLFNITDIVFMYLPDCIYRPYNRLRFRLLFPWLFS